MTARLILPSSWASVTAAVGGGPLLVRNHKAVFKTNENFAADQLMSRDARAAVGQLDDGRVILVAVDGGRPGYSVGMTTYELAQTMVRLGAVTAAALEPGKAVTAAFQGQVLNRPSGKGEQPVKEALLVQYRGVYAPPPSAAQLGRAATGGRAAARVHGRPPVDRDRRAASRPTARPRPVDTRLAPAGHVPLRAGRRSTSRARGTGRSRATDDQSRQSVADRPFLVDFTLSAPEGAAAAKRRKVGFTLSRAASVTLQIETKDGALVAKLPPASLEAARSRSSGTARRRAARRRRTARTSRA